MGEFIGYARVSSRSQSLDIQVQALVDAGVKEEHLYQEKVSGRKRDGRAALEEMLARGIRKGDHLGLHPAGPLSPLDPRSPSDR